MLAPSTIASSKAASFQLLKVDPAADSFKTKLFKSVTSPFEEVSQKISNLDIVGAVSNIAKDSISL